MAEQKQKLRLLYRVHFLVSVSATFIAIFIPIYLLKLDYTVRDLVGLYLLTGAFKLVLSPLAFWGISKMGCNTMMIVGLAGQIAGFGLLISLPAYQWPLLWIAAAKGAHGIFYYAAFNVAFAESRKHGETAAKVGILNVLGIITGIIAPLVGGYLGTYHGINWVYGAAMGLFTAAAVLLLIQKDHFRAPFSLKRVQLSQPKRDYIANFSQNFSGLADIFGWTLMVFFIIPTYIGVGVIASISAITSLLITVFISKNKSIFMEKRFIDGGAWLAALATCIRAFVTTPPHVVFVNFLSGISATILSNAFVARYYKNSDQEQRLEYMFGMEAANSIAWICYFSVLLAASYHLSQQALLMLAVLMALPANFLIRRIR